MSATNTAAELTERVVSAHPPALILDARQRQSLLTVRTLGESIGALPAALAAAITGAVARRFTITMLMRHYGTPRDREARGELATALPDAEIGQPDEIGVFDIRLDADDLEQALQRVWDGVAASGTDDHIMFLEHPDLPEHWRPRSGRPGG